MGVFGLRRYVENHGVTRLVKEPCEGVHHLCFDMNGILHTCYNSKITPTVDLLATAVLEKMQLLLDYFEPSKSIVVAFDGPAPISKLLTQRSRRKAMVSQVLKGVDLNEAQIVCGGISVLRIEKVVEEFLLKKISDGELKIEHLVVNGCTVPGEGECKVTDHLLNTAKDSERYHPDDVTVIVGNDSDLVLNCIGCTPYHNMFVVSPYSFIMTCVGDLIYHWAKPGNGISVSFLPRLRTDFVFITLLAGGDHYPGVEEEVASLWRKYRETRAAGNFAKKPLIGAKFQVNGELLRTICHRDRKHNTHYVGSKNKRKSEKAKAAMQQTGNSEVGVKLVKCGLWALATTCDGKCPDYHMVHRGEGAKPGELRAAADKIMNNGSCVHLTTSEEMPLKPFWVYVAVITNPALLPIPVQRVLEQHQDLKKITRVESVNNILSCVNQIAQHLNVKDLSKDEKELLEFGAPREYTFEGNKPTKSTLAAASSFLSGWWGSSKKQAEAEEKKGEEEDSKHDGGGKEGKEGEAPVKEDLFESAISFEYPTAIKHLNFVTFGSSKVNTLQLPKSHGQSEEGVEKKGGVVASVIGALGSVLGGGKGSKAEEETPAKEAEDSESEGEGEQD